MERIIFRNNYFNISLVTGLVLGVGYGGDDKEIAVFIGPLVITIKLYGFNRKQKKRKPIKL